MMSNRETLIHFIETHYDSDEQNRLADAVGIDSKQLPLHGIRERTIALLLNVEREGTAAALLATLERDFPNEAPDVEWAGARIGSAPIPSSASSPQSVQTSAAGYAITGTARADAPVEMDETDEIEILAPVRPSLSDEAVAHAQAPLLSLRDGVDELEAARGTSPAAEDDDRIVILPQNPEGAELRHEPGFEPLPFRFVHGYTLPTHWARRDAEIADLLEEIRSNKHSILSMVAIGGTGKSALTRKLLDELPNFNVHVDGALWFSFYVEPEFDRFLTEACRYLIPDFDPVVHPSPYEKGVLLREAMDKGHFLLVLDGIEVLLVSDKDRKDYGAFIDRALREFLEGVCEGSKSQIFISSRWPLTDLLDNPAYKMLELKDLSLDAAEELLDSYGVEGEADGRIALCTRFGSHALTLQVLADYLTRFHAGRTEGVKEIQQFSPDAAQGIKLQAALDGYWQRLDSEERFFMTRMSAFRGGVDERSFLVLNKSGDAYSPSFRTMVTRLIKSPLVSVERREGRPRLTAHPLIKTFFYERMADSERNQTHRALKDYSQGLPLPDRPRTLEDYEPLLEACHHCLQVGLYTEAYQIYRRNNMDNALRWWGHYSQAWGLLEQLRQASQGTTPAWQSERWQKSWVENETALLAMLRGETEQANERFRNSAEMDRLAGDGPGESASWQNVASVLAMRGDFWASLAALEKSQTIEAQIGRYEKEDMLAGLEGVCHAELGQAQHALELLSRALGISTQRPNARAVCYWSWRMGDLYLRVRQTERGKKSHENALQMAVREQFRDYEGHTLRGLGDASRLLRDTNQSRTHYTDALRIARTLGNPYLENEVRIGIARLEESEHNYRDAQLQAQQVLDRADGRYLVQATEAHIVLARCARTEKNQEALVKHLMAARTLLETTCHFWTRQETESLLAKEPELRGAMGR